jgi:hypothetical protein
LEVGLLLPNPMLLLLWKISRGVKHFSSLEPRV